MSAQIKCRYRCKCGLRHKYERLSKMRMTEIFVSLCLISSVISFRYFTGAPLFECRNDNERKKKINKPNWVVSMQLERVDLTCSTTRHWTSIIAPRTFFYQHKHLTIMDFCGCWMYRWAHGWKICEALVPLE